METRLVVVVGAATVTTQVLPTIYWMDKIRLCCVLRRLQMCVTRAASILIVPALMLCMHGPKLMPSGSEFINLSILALTLILSRKSWVQLVWTMWIRAFTLGISSLWLRMRMPL
jgi:hypothetical protein